VSRPKPSFYPAKTRIAPAELDIWQVIAKVTQYKEEADK